MPVRAHDAAFVSAAFHGGAHMLGMAQGEGKNRHEQRHRGLQSLGGATCGYVAASAGLCMCQLREFTADDGQEPYRQCHDEGAFVYRDSDVCQRG